MSRRLLHKRVLITDYYDRNPSFYEDLLFLLVQDGASVLALLNATTLESGEFTRKFPRITTVVLNTCRNYNDDGTDSNNVMFDNAWQKKLVDSLPNVDYILNFAGPAFPDSFVKREARIRYKVENIEFGKILSRLRASNLFPEHHRYIILHVVPDLALDEALRSSFGFGVSSSEKNDRRHHYTRGIPEYTPNEVPLPVSTLALNPYISRTTILFLTLKMRITKYVDETFFGQFPPSDWRDQLFRQETDSLNRTLKEIYSKSIWKLMKLRRECSRDRDVEDDKIRAEHTARPTVRPILGSQSQDERVDRALTQIADSRRNRDEAKNKAEMQRRLNRLDKTYKGQLNFLNEVWYTDILEKQAKAIRQITKSYAEKVSASEVVYRSSFYDVV